MFIHLFLLLGISFTLPGINDDTTLSPPIEITLVNDFSEIEPLEADYLAQRNNDSSGEESTPLDNAWSSLGNNNAPQAASQGGQRDIQNEPVKYADQNVAQTINDQTQSENSGEAQLSKAELLAQINLSLLNDNALPREHYVDARTKEDKYVAYIENWRTSVQHIGNLNYPDEAKQRNIAGSLVLDTIVAADGSLTGSRILTSSGEKVLDDAAIRIVALAAPFPAFPDAIRREVDQLHIVRVWEFRNNRIKSIK